MMCGLSAKNSMIGQVIGHYRVSAKLGAGGMGEVYRATDERLGREVALKVLPPGMHQDPASRERFQREARAASALNHPNIAVIYDIGEHEGQPYLVMELLDGQTVRERISNSGFALDEILEVGIQIADALEAAHGRGIVHRDIKPANLFLTTRAQVKVLDFGLAKMSPHQAAAAASSDAPTLLVRDEQLTSPGLALGTVAYMSPEQARGQELDARTDLFSFGAVLYEMAMRRQAFAGDTSAIVFNAIFHHDPVAASHATTTMPPRLGEIIGKLLEKDRELRYQSASGVRADLKRLKRDTESGRSSAVSAAKLDAPRRKPAAGKSIDSLVVLPFENGSGDPEYEYLSDGIAETIINRLSKLPKVRVVPRGIAFRYKGATDPFAAAAELNVRAVVSGRVQIHKDTLVVRAELVDVARQDQLWGERYNRKMTDLLEVQEEIAGEIAGHLQQTLASSSGAKRPKPATRASQVNPEAYRLYMQGVHHAYRWKEEDLRRGIELFQQAINADASFAPSYSGLAYALVLTGFYAFINPRQAYSQGKAAALKALELDPTSAEAHVALGWVAFQYDHTAETSRQHYQKAVELQPNLAIARHGLAIWYNQLRRHEEALVEIRRAVELDPLTPLFHAHHGWILHCGGYDREAVEVLEGALQVHPDDYYILRILVYACKGAGRPELGIRAAERVASATTNKHQALGMLGLAHAQAGNREAAAQYFAQLASEPEMDAAAGYYQALGNTILGNYEVAIDWLEKTYTRGTGILSIVATEPMFDPLRPYPRFAAFLKKLGLPG